MATMLRRVTWCMRRTICQLHTNPASVRPSFKSLPRPNGLSSHPPRLALATGILAFFGLDEEARLEKKYSDEVESHSDNFDEELKNTIKRGILDMQKGELKKAENMFHIALRMANDMNHQAAITYIYDLMANLAFDMGDYQKAERLFISVMQRLIGLKGVAQNDNAVVEMAIKIATIHGRSGKDKQQLAEQGFLFCIDTQKAKLKAEDEAEADENTLALYGMSRDSYGQFLMANGRVKAAKEQFQEALQTSLKVSGEWSEQTVNLQNSLATCLSMLGETQEADAIFSDVIAKAKSMSSENLASFLVNRGLHKVQSQLFSQAKRDCTQAQGLARRSGDKDTLQQSELCLKKVRDKQTL